MQFNQIVPGLTLAEGIVLGVLAYVLFRKKSAKLAHCQRAWGDVVEVKEYKGSEGPTRHAPPGALARDLTPWLAPGDLARAD